MSEESQEIKIVGVNKEAIKTSPDKKDYWVVSFKLSSKPDRSWEEKFYEAQQKNTSEMKRKARLAEDAINVEVAAADDLQKVLDALKIAVAEANVLCENDYQRKLKIRRELEALQKKQRDATQKFKDDSEKLVF